MDTGFRMLDSGCVCIFEAANSKSVEIGAPGGVRIAGPGTTTGPGTTGPWTIGLPTTTAIGVFINRNKFVSSLYMGSQKV